MIKTYNTNAQTPESAGTANAMNTGYKTKSVGVGCLLGRSIWLLCDCRLQNLEDIKLSLHRWCCRALYLLRCVVRFVSWPLRACALPCAIDALNVALPQPFASFTCCYCRGLQLSIIYWCTGNFLKNNWGFLS